MTFAQSLRRLLPAVLTPQTVKETLESGAADARLELARRDDAPPEALYFLAQDKDPAIRRAIAANPANSLKSDALLLADESEDIRAELSRKIGRLAPGLTTSERNRVREQALVILQALASDQADSVRTALAEEISRCADVPASVVRALAEDPVLSVCGPILEYSPLLSDADLQELIAASRMSGALSAIARRDGLSGDLSAAIVATGSESAVAALLGNSNAQIREDTLDTIIDGAPAIAAWHEPLVLRANLSIRAMRRIAGFVAADLVTRMVNVHGLPEATGQELLCAVRLRLEQTPLDADDALAAEEKAAMALAHGRIDDSWVLEHAAKGERALVIAGLGLAAGIGVRVAHKMAHTRDPKAMFALVWKAGLAPRTGYELQMSLIHLTPAQLLLLPEGLGWPQSPAQMDWILQTAMD